MVNFTLYFLGGVSGLMMNMREVGPLAIQNSSSVAELWLVYHAIALHANVVMNVIESLVCAPNDVVETQKNDGRYVTFSYIFF